MRQRHILMTLVLVIAGLGVCSLAAAADLQVTAVLFPDRTTVNVPLMVTPIGPKAATAEASVYYKDGQAQIEISYKGMQPAVMFAGNITTYSVFAVTRGGAVENLGELNVVEAKGSRKFSTGQKEFGLVISADPITGVQVVSRLVVMVSGAPKDKAVTATPFAFTGIGKAYYQDLVKPGNPSIADFPPYKPGAEPVELWKARKIVEMAEGMKLAPGMEKNLTDAKLQLNQATNTAASSGGSHKVVADYAGRAATLAGDAIRATVKADYDRMVAEEKAKAAATATKLDVTSKEKAEVEAMLAQVKVEKAQVQKDRDELAGMLAGAMGQVAETRASALGAVMTLPGISFQTNSAVLTKKAEMTLAKLAGVALVFPKVNFLIEGFTDATGKIEANVKLSTARAKSVYDVLLAQGIPAARLAFKGRGPESPVASNDKPEGRAQNRRVEITALTPAK